MKSTCMHTWRIGTTVVARDMYEEKFSVRIYVCVFVWMYEMEKFSELKKRDKRSQMHRRVVFNIGAAHGSLRDTFH